MTGGAGIDLGKAKAGETFTTDDGAEMVVIPKSVYDNLILCDAIHGGEFAGSKIVEPDR